MGSYRRLLAVVLAVLVGPVALADPAAAHTLSGVQPTNYRSEIISLRPASRRFLLDECVSPLVKLLLLGSGHNVVHVHDVGMTSAPDSEVLEAAAAEERVVVTMDTDFGALVAHSGSRLPSVVLFRGEVTRRPHAQAGHAASQP